MSSRSQPSSPAATAIQCVAARFEPDRPLPDDVLMRIFHQATRAPSPSNLQPWRFVLVRDARHRRRLKTCAFSPPCLATAPVLVIALAYRYAHRTHLEPMIAQHHAFGAIGADASAALRARTTREFDPEAAQELWATQSTMVAVGRLLCAAEAEGIAYSVALRFDAERVRSSFGVPDDHSICCLLGLGFATELDPLCGRFGLDDVCYAEHFGQPWGMGDG